MIALLLGVAAAVFMMAHLSSVVLYLWRLRGKPGAGGVIGHPRISLVRPVYGLDTFDAETLSSSFAQDYPEYEVVFCAASAGDPAVTLLRRLIAEHPEIPARILIGDLGHSANPKLDNIWKGWLAAESDWICMADSNLLLPPDYLATLAAAWGPGTGMVSSPAIGTRPAGAGGHLEAAFLNSNQVRLQFAADSLGMAYAQGKTLFFNRPLLERAGGLVALDRRVAEDASATIAIRGLGLAVALTPLPFPQPIGVKTVRQVWGRQLRWSLLRRDAFPVLFLFEILNGAVLPTAVFAAALAAADVSLWSLLPWLGVWYGAEAFLMLRAGWPASTRDFAALPFRDLLLPVIWIATFRKNGFEWRGNAMASSAES